MNAGLFETSYGAVLRPQRVRYMIPNPRYNGQAIVLGTCDDVSGGTTRAKGSGAPTTDRTDLVLQVPVTRGVLGGAAIGAGALIVQVPDGTVFGGNRRGIGAVDWQVVRSGATRVASGSYSVISGGSSGSASGDYSVVSGGIGGDASATSATISGGDGNAASGSYSTVSGGAGNAASGQAANVSGGQGNTASGGYTTASGLSNSANGDYSFIAGGYLGIARLAYGASAHASGQFAVQGDAQTKIHILRASVAGALSNQPLLANGATNTANFHVSLPNDSTYLFEAKVVARRTDANDESAGWIIRGVVDRNASAATIALVGTPTVTEIARDAALNASVTADVDTTLGVLRILATVSDAGKTVRFVAKVETVEVVG